MPHSFRNSIPDGVFGPGTEATLMQFQEDSGLAATGVADPETLVQLDGLQPHIAEPDIKTAENCPDREGLAPIDIAAYLQLLGCAETKLTLEPPAMLSFVRQLSFGSEEWSRRSYLAWQYVIPAAVRFQNGPELILDPVIATLRKTEVVEDPRQRVMVDITHTITGLDAMMRPIRHVGALFKVASWEVLDVAGHLSNEEFATWAGDLGSAVATKALRDTIAGHPIEWGPKLDPTGLVSDADLEGDIDAYAIRHALVGATCAASPLTAIGNRLDLPLSSLLRSYYQPSEQVWIETRANRYLCFVRALGGNIEAGAISNKSQLIDKITPRINDFAFVYSSKVVLDIFKADPFLSPSLLNLGEISRRKLVYARAIAERLMDWLESRITNMPPAAFISLAGSNPPEVRAFSPTSGDVSGRTTLQAAVRNVPTDARLTWSASPAGRLHFIDAAAAITPVLALAPGSTTVTFEVRSPDGSRVLQRRRMLVSVPQFVTVEEDEGGAFAEVLRQFEVNDGRQLLLAEARKTVSYLLADANVRVIWTLAPFNEQLPAQFRKGGLAVGKHTRVLRRGKRPHLDDTTFGETSNPGGDNNLIGPYLPNELVEIWTGNYRNPRAPLGKNTARLIDRLKGAQLNEVRVKTLLLTALGRLIGETTAHEIAHAMLGQLPTGDWHGPERGSASFHDFDLLNSGADRPWVQRTAIEVLDEARFPDEGSYWLDPAVPSLSTFTRLTRPLVERRFPIRPAAC